MVQHTDDYLVRAKEHDMIPEAISYKSLPVCFYPIIDNISESIDYQCHEHHGTTKSNDQLPYFRHHGDFIASGKDTRIQHQLHNTPESCTVHSYRA